MISKRPVPVTEIYSIIMIKGKWIIIGEYDLKCEGFKVINMLD